MREYDERPGEPPPGPWGEEPVELIMPEDFLGSGGVPLDGRRMGLDRNTEEGAWVAFAGSLNPGKLSHRIVAWVLLLGFVVPLLLGLVRPLY